MPQVTFRNVQPEEAIKFFDDKQLRDSFDWRELWQQEHARQFTVAKSAGFDIVGDIHDAVGDAVKNGTTFDDFVKQLVPTLQKKGWWGQGEVRDPQTGELVTAQLGSPRRLNTIFDTNISTAYAAGRWERIQRVKDGRPYLRYDHLEGQLHPRLLHASWDGITLPVDDPFWKTHYGPNGWGCHCSTISMSQDQYDRAKTAGTIKTDAPPLKLVSWTNKRTGQTIMTPEGIDPGFGYNVGIAHVRENTPVPLDGDPSIRQDSLTRQLYPVEGRPDMPAPRSASANDLLPRGLSTDQAVDAFLGEIEKLVQTKTGDDQFAVNDGAVVKDVIGLPMSISDRFLVKDDGTGKIDARRAPFLKLLARALIDPDEIWMSFENAAAGMGYQLRRRYVARWLVPDQQAAVVVIEESKDGWRGVTSFIGDDDQYLDNQVRLGWNAYRRGG